MELYKINKIVGPAKAKHLLGGGGGRRGRATHIVQSITPFCQRPAVDGGKLPIWCFAVVVVIQISRFYGCGESNMAAHGFTCRVQFSFRHDRRA